MEIGFEIIVLNYKREVENESRKIAFVVKAASLFHMLYI